MEMALAILMSTMMMVSDINPISLSMTLLILSIMSTSLIFKATTSSWLAFILIITFSSGMLTLFFYTTTLMPNEISKPKKILLPAAASAMLIIPTVPHLSKTQSSMKFFSNYNIIMTMALILILTLLAISTHGYNPHQSLRSSF